MEMLIGHFYHWEYPFINIFQLEPLLIIILENFLTKSIINMMELIMVHTQIVVQKLQVLIIVFHQVFQSH